MGFRILHTADWHFSTNTDKLVEVVRTSDAFIAYAEANPPDAIILAGDTVDEYDGRIRIDSECARALISAVQRCADIAPVAVIRGTKSHDRDTPELLQHLRSAFPIYVASSIEQVKLVGLSDGSQVFLPVEAPEAVNHDLRAVFTLVPSMDKSHLMATVDAGIRDGNQVFREAVHDLYAGLGLINQGFNSRFVPTILVTHGMLTGAVFSSGQTAIGEDLEFGLNDLHAACCAYTALGHVHKHQVFAGNVVYSGSLGRLNYGEPEAKGFVNVLFERGAVTDMLFISTPAREFCFGEVAEFVDAESTYEAARSMAARARGCDVRFRLSLPEERRGEIDRDALEQIFLLAGATRVKLEISVIPKQRARAEGISRVDALPEKVVRWGVCVGEEVPEDVLALAGVIEGLSVEELQVQAQTAAEADSAPPSPKTFGAAVGGYAERIHSAALASLDPKSGEQGGLF